MSTVLQSVTLDRDGRSLSRSGQCIAIVPFDGPESAQTIDSASGFDLQERRESSGASTFKRQLVTYGSSPPLRPSNTALNEKACPTRDRASPTRWQRFCLDRLTTYRVLILTVMMINMGFLVPQTTFNTAAGAPLTATVANIMAAVLLRQEEIINFSFKLISHLPPTLPVSIRKSIGDLHHYGGLHVGCALSALLWYITFTGLNTLGVLHSHDLGDMTTPLYIDIITSYVVLIAILLVCLTAISRFRARFHNTFEATHRFGGWVTVLVSWIHAGITTLAPNASKPLYLQPLIWMLAVTTIFIILPWLRIRRVPITAHPISAREVQINFPFQSMPFTSTLQTSTAPLTEWHAFATIPVSDINAKIIVSRAGDWTSSIISSPPTHLWIRHPPRLNFLTLAPLFNSLLLVATGAGIGPMLSLLSSPSIKRMRAQARKIKVMWCAYDSFAPHWAFVLDAVREVDKEAAVWDSKEGRPDIAFEARSLATSEGVEAVMVVSNPKVTKEVLDESKIAGLAAYGAVFDS